MGSPAEFLFQAGRIDLDGRYLIDAESVDKRGAGETSDISGFRPGKSYPARTISQRRLGSAQWQTGPDFGADWKKRLRVSRE